MNSSKDNELRSIRSSLKIQGRFADAILVQQQVLASAKEFGCVQDISNAWNMRSHLFHEDRQLTQAEYAARQALTTYTREQSPWCLETLATYEMKLAILLAAQRKFGEAVLYGELAITHFSDFHRPDSQFLRARIADVAQMKSCRDAPS